MLGMPTVLSRKELYDKVWSVPIQTLSKELGLSDVGLAKVCQRYGIPVQRARDEERRARRAATGQRNRPGNACPNWRCRPAPRSGMENRSDLVSRPLGRQLPRRRQSQSRNTHGSPLNPNRRTQSACAMAFESPTRCCEAHEKRGRSSAIRCAHWVSPYPSTSRCP
jgi:hypothetical protein